jgi:hypothetical protein
VAASSIFCSLPTFGKGKKELSSINKETQNHGKKLDATPNIEA